jgi:hypothetical protein
MRFLLSKSWSNAQFILLYIDEIQPQTCQRHQKYQQWKEDSLDALRKATSITKKDTKLINLQFHQYCKCELIEELICNKIAKLIYMG